MIGNHEILPIHVFVGLYIIVWSQETVPIYLCAWHVIKAWQVYALEKIKDVVVC